MNRYHIAELERLSGIKAHTIRMWEKRYGIIRPHRTATNIRLYDDDQLRKLLNVATLVRSGLKISDVAALKGGELERLIEKQGAAEDPGVAESAFITDLISASYLFDEDAFEHALSAAIVRNGIYGCMVKVVYPFLHRVGLLWMTGDIAPAQEHFASNLIRRKLLAATDGLKRPDNKAARFLLFLPENETHELGLLVAEYMLRAHGYAVLNLGQSVPRTNLSEAIRQWKPTHLLTFIITRVAPRQIRQLLKDLLLEAGNAGLILCGSSEIISPRTTPRVTVLSDPDELLLWLSSAVRSKNLSKC